MINEEYTSSDGLVSVDYMKGHVLPEETNKIRCHTRYELLVIIRGSVTYSDNKGVTKVTDKSAVFTKAYDVHNPFVSYDYLYERYRISFDKSFFNSALREGINVDRLISESYKNGLDDLDFEELIASVKALYNLIKNQSDDRLYECVYLLSILIKGKESALRASLNEKNYVTDVIECIKNEYRSRLTAEELAARFFVSRGKLMYDFKEYCNMTLLDYITLTRIDAAKELLLNGYSVTVASDECGFSSPSYFIKVFRSITGMTPLKFQIKFSQNLRNR